MPPRKKKVAAADHEPEEQRATEVVEEEDVAQLKLGEWRDNFEGDGYKIRAERWHDGLRKWVFLDTLDFDGWDLQTLRQWVEKAVSRFRLSLLDNEGLYVKGGRFEQCVANPDWRDAVAAPAPVAPPPPPPDPMSSPVVQMMIENQKAQNVQLLELLKVVAGRPTGPDPLEMFLKLRQLMPEPQKMPSMKEQAEALVAIKDLMGDGNSGEGSWISEIKEGVSLFQQLTEIAAKKKAVGAVPPAAAPRPAIPPAAAAPKLANPPPETPMANSALLETVKFYVPIFVHKAERNDDPADAAQFLLDEIDSDIMPELLKAYPITSGIAYSQLIAGAKDAAKLEQIYAFAPELAPYRDWVKQVIDKAIELHENPVETDTAEEV